MPPFGLKIFAEIYLVLAFVSALFIAYDIFWAGNRPKMPVMDIVWPVTAFYYGPFAIWTY
jgi:hypothetical protein